MARYFDQLMRYVEHMGLQQWLLVALAIVFAGFLCLRGFGSRSNY